MLFFYTHPKFLTIYLKGLIYHLLMSSVAKSMSNIALVNSNDTTY